MNHILVLIKANLLHLWNNWAADGYGDNTTETNLVVAEKYLSQDNNGTIEDTARAIWRDHLEASRY